MFRGQSIGLDAWHGACGSAAIQAQSRFVAESIICHVELSRRLLFATKATFRLDAPTVLIRLSPCWNTTRDVPLTFSGHHQPVPDRSQWRIQATYAPCNVPGRN